MKKYFVKVCSLFAAITLLVAHTGAGLASLMGWYQPKVPQSLVK